MFDFPVDIIYTWVNGNDQEWLLKKNNLLKKYDDFHNTDEVSGKHRFFDRNELKYSLRSVGKFCPWVRNIYLVTDNQVPDWINLDNKQLKLIDHKDIFLDDVHLPTFNSNAIEMNLHHIKDLSTNFISFNDDCFIGRPTEKKDFFHASEKPKIFTGKLKQKSDPSRLINPEFLKKNNPHQYAILNSRRLIYEKFNIIINQDLRHSVKALNKKIMVDLEKEFPDAFNKTLSNQFRDNTDTWIMSLHAFYSIAKGFNIPYYMPPIRRDMLRYKLNFIRKNRDYVYVPLNLDTNRFKSKLSAIKKYSPLTFCINDGPNANKSIDMFLNDFFNELYPEKSQYEK